MSWVPCRLVVVRIKGWGMGLGEGGEGEGKGRTWMSNTCLWLNAGEAKEGARPRMGPSRREEERAALYPGRWADWMRTIWGGG